MIHVHLLPNWDSSNPITNWWIFSSSRYLSKMVAAPHKHSGMSLHDSSSSHMVDKRKKIFHYRLTVLSTRSKLHFEMMYTNFIANWNRFLRWYHNLWASEIKMTVDRRLWIYWRTDPAHNHRIDGKPSFKIIASSLRFLSDPSMKLVLIIGRRALNISVAHSA